jgi:hypothetical protein
MIQNENYDEEVNEYNEEYEIDREMNMKEIEDVSDIKNKETEQDKEENNENDKFNLPLTMENQKNSDYLKINNEQNSFDELSLFKELEDKWLDIEKKRKKNLKKKNNDLLDSKSNNSTIYSLGILQNWKGIIKESRKKYNERKLREDENNEFEKYVKNKMKELKSLTNPNINTEENVKYKIKSYFDDDGKKNYSNYHFHQTSYNNNNTSNSGIKSFLKEDDEIDKKINKINFFKNTQKKMPLIQKKENKIKNKIRNVYGIITKKKDLVNNKTDSKFSEMSINELNKNFDEIMGNLSNDYKQKSKMSITKKFKKQNIDYSNSFSNNNQNKTRNNIEKKLMENKILLNEMLPESGIGNKKEFKNINESFNKNSFFTYSIDEKRKNKINLNPIRISSVYKTNNFEKISNQFAGLISPTVSKLIYY